MKIKELTKMMDWLYNEAHDMESYNDLWKSIQTLYNLGLIGENFRNAAVKKDRELFEKANA